ncbi:MAG: VCBS repeat-containing protein [Deltaproteobacteria bacterium]|nr:VCBS repeat-containing protein [Deltaproteobacteria bacterium]
MTTFSSSVRHLVLTAGLLIGLLVGFLPACDSGNVGGATDGGVQVDGDIGLLFPDSVPIPDTKGPACTKNEDCNGGVCLAGSCCPSAKQVCGTLCCPSTTTCFANACVVPGKVCYSTGDCDPGQYCEPSLGAKQGQSDGGVPADAGVPPVDSGQVCLKPIPHAGRCLDLPKRCGPTPTPGCLQPCEFKPTVGKLNAVQKWHWGTGDVKEYTNHVDVWSTPVVARLTDTNCDGKVNELDPPNIIFISGNAQRSQCAAVPPACLTGVLRVLDGATGTEIFSLRKPGPGTTGFSAVTMALGDVNRDGHVDIIGVDSKGHIVLIDYTGKLLATSDKPIPESRTGTAMNTAFGWGGGLALADMDGDGNVEVAYGRSIFTIDAKGTQITFKWSGTHGRAGGNQNALSIFSDLNGDGKQELIVGDAAYTYDGKTFKDLWYNAAVSDGYPAVADFDGDGKPEVAVVGSGKNKGSLFILAGTTGKLLAGPYLLPGTGSGGPPTIADFDGDKLHKRPEVGVAKATFYSVTKVDLKAPVMADRLKPLWKQINHDFSSSVTGSTVFDFEGDGIAEVIYNDECFIWVYDGKTGDVKFAHPTTSFTATEASLVADVDGDGRAEMVMISNRASAANWKCNVAPWTTADPKLNRPAWVPPKNDTAWSGITVFGDKANSWVGTRTLWNEHSYHVSNICDSRDSACFPNDNHYGFIPKAEMTNYTVKWLNNFRQNVQDKGLFDAPDATVTIRVDCTTSIEGGSTALTLHATLRNLGLALLPAGVHVGIFIVETAGDRLLYEHTTASPLFPGQALDITYTTKTADKVTAKSRFRAKIIIDPKNPTFNECRSDNNESKIATNPCVLQ